MPLTIEDLRLRLELAADNDGPTRIEVAPIEAAELLEALPNPDRDLTVESELALIGTVVALFDDVDDPAALDRVMSYLVNRYPEPRR